MIVAAFVLGLIGGILVDRSVGGPGGFTLGLFVLLIPAVLTLVGPLSQEFWSQRFAKETVNRARFREHSDLLLGRCISYLPTAVLHYDIINWGQGESGLYAVRVNTGEGGRGPSIESLPLWSYCREHLLADPSVKTILSEIESRTETGRKQKASLDEQYGSLIGTVLKEALGADYQAATRETGWIEWPPPAQWYPEYLITQLRYLNAPGQLEATANPINHNTGDPPTLVRRLKMNGQLVLQVRDPLTVDADRFRTAYNRLREDAGLRVALNQAQATEREDARLVRNFAELARDYAESVEASQKHLTGICAACSHLLPR